MTHDDLLTTADDLARDLAAAHRDLASTRKMALMVKTQAWMRATDDTVTGRARAADVAAHEYEAQVLELEGEVRALTVELQHIDRQLAVMKGDI